MSDLARQTRAVQAQQKNLQDMLTPGAQGALRAALSERIGVERFMQAAITSFQSNAKLRACTQDSILGALFISAQLGLEIGGPAGLAYLVPYGNQATFVLGYRGLIELFYRTGQIVKVGAFLLYEGDAYEEIWDPQIGETFTLRKASRSDRGEKVGVIAYVITKLGGPPIWVHLDRDEILKRRPSKWTGGPWEQWEEQMWLKTGVKALGRWVRQSTDDRSLEAAITADETIQRRIEGIPEPVVERIPVEGSTHKHRATVDPAPAPAPREAPPVPEPAPEDPEAAYAQQSDAEYQAWLATQEPV